MTALTRDIAVALAEQSSDVIIPNNFTSIDDNAFDLIHYATNSTPFITSVEIPDSVTSIGNYAFARNYSLGSIDFGDNVETIGEGAFHSSTPLVNIDLPSSLTSIGDRAFYYSGLTALTIPEGVTSVGDSAFHLNRALTNVQFPNTLVSIGEQAFKHTSIENVVIPDSVTSIGSWAFQTLSRPNVELPEGIALGSNVFNNNAIINYRSGNANSSPTGIDISSTTLNENIAADTAVGIDCYTDVVADMEAQFGPMPVFWKVVPGLSAEAETEDDAGDTGAGGRVCTDARTEDDDADTAGSYGLI